MTQLTDPPQADIIVLNWNNYEDTARCLSSLQDLDYPNYTVYVVDNGSTDDSLQRLRNEFSFCEFIANDENRGFAGGCNVGIETAMSNGADYTLLLNNDTTVPADFLSHLVEAAERDTHVALVGGVIEHMDSGDIWFAGSTLQPEFVKTSHQTEVHSDDPYETEHVTGALMLLNSNFVREHGALDEEYFFGFEDAELSWRARQHGWRVMVAPDARIEHDVSSTAGSRSPFKFYHATRNRLQFARNLPPHQQAVFYLFFISTRMIRGVQWFSENPERVKAILHGLVDYARGRPPRPPEAFGLGADS